jgi:hypothetical protein
MNVFLSIQVVKYKLYFFLEGSPQGVNPREIADQAFEASIIFSRSVGAR